MQSPEKHRQAIAELAAVGDSKRTYCAQLSSQLMDNDRKLEMVVKVRLLSFLRNAMNLCLAAGSCKWCWSGYVCLLHKAV